MGRHSTPEEGESASPPEPTSPSPGGTAWLGRLLDWFTGSRGVATLGVGTLIAALLGLVKDINFARWSSPLAFIICGVAGAFFWRGRRRTFTAAAVLGVLLSGAATVRAYSAPGNTEFYYDGSAMTQLQPAPEGGIPLTTDPRDGTVTQTILPEASDAGFMEISCFQEGRLAAGGQSVPIHWARIESGKFQTLWIPLASLRGLAPGSARTLLDCSNWRWLLQNYGTK
ncbi:membrane hypothetical protein [uncultured Mycobacterium sp.]|uniref:Uncharacterized protein n=1 Tax=uncultured Mycobacterium sp. TaxID=171292 RepID=A0A1Y5PNH4_9MYCO|nr:membrane hypothetical protein [uncultured Mycobacterium sp.]